jgi:hypothetical protein
MKQADIAINLARENAKLFHTADGTAFADIRVENHRETWAVRSRGFKLWLTREYHRACHGAPNSDAMQCALNALEAIACFDGREHQVSLRIGSVNEKIYLDLGTPRLDRRRNRRGRVAHCRPTSSSLPTQQRDGTPSSARRRR